jgi:medium-chain acyl-[acyl-carrier-protein] hydrolase
MGGNKMILENEYTVKLSEIGKGNKATNKTILSYLEDIGGIHSNKAGYGIFEIEETHLSWILLGWRLQVIRRPKYAEKVKIKTWSKGVIKLYTYREFEVYDEQENLIIKASSKWILMDIQKGRIVRIEPELIAKYEPELDKDVFGIEEFEKIKEPDEYQFETEYTVRRNDIDVNNHMHNLNYIELANEALPENVYRGALFNDVKITYKKEIKLGDTIKCKYAFKDDKHIAVLKNQEGSIVHAIIEMY